jgi:hypothetical protein
MDTPEPDHAATNGQVVNDDQAATNGQIDGHRPPAPAVGGVTDAWTTVLHDVRTLTLELAEAGIVAARRAITIPALPAVPRLQNGWTRVEDALAQELKTRLDRLDPAPGHPHATRDDGWVSPTELLGDLLTASEDDDTATAREELYRALLLRLVPDEARLLATLSDGQAHPMVHVQTKSRTVLAHVSTLAEVAGLTLPEAAETYVSHLLTLGLAEEGPEDEQLAGGYERLLGRTRVRTAEEVAREDGRLGTRVVRRTLRISRLGAELWLNCHTPAV